MGCSVGPCDRSFTDMKENYGHKALHYECKNYGHETLQYRSKNTGTKPYTTENIDKKTPVVTRFAPCAMRFASTAGCPRNGPSTDASGRSGSNNPEESSGQPGP